MKMSRWSEYDKYVVMVDGGRDIAVSGVSQGYQAFLEFKLVKSALQEIAKSPGKMYTYKGEIYKSPITAAKAARILENIEICKWDSDIREVAKQIGTVTYFLYPSIRRKK